MLFCMNKVLLSVIECLYSFLPKNQRKHKEKHMEYTRKKSATTFLVKNFNFFYNKASLHLINTNQQKITIVKKRLNTHSVSNICLNCVFFLLFQKVPTKALCFAMFFCFCNFICYSAILSTKNTTQTPLFSNDNFQNVHSTLKQF